ncbi:hypothetical protein BDW75DRAFT_201980 [Aspergillus navahoensis]
MRFIVPLAFLGATATTVVAENAQDILQDSVPQCLQTCVGNTFENLSGCDLTDTDCLCKVGTPSSDSISSAQDSLNSCFSNANCTASERQEISKLDFDSLLGRANDLCSKFRCC